MYKNKKKKNRIPNNLTNKFKNYKLMYKKINQHLIHNQHNKKVNLKINFQKIQF